MTSSVADALVGRVIDGRYRIISHLADGGMASVYVAMDARLDREVALKLMRPGLAVDEVFVERFRTEARSAARLSHPNVVAVYDQGEDRGDVFLAMELVEGKTLREVIHEEAPLTARESLAVLEPILAALGAAHTAGIVHRDVKPENVIVRHDGEVKVADFGLARAVANQAATSQSGVVLGTVSYLSPEQVERGTADGRSDIYAAGLLLFEMLTGRKAVIGETPIQIAYRHVHGGVPAPSSLVPSVPADLDELVARATALDPADRFASTAEFASELRTVRRNLSPVELDHRGAKAPTAVSVASASHTLVHELAAAPQSHAQPATLAQPLPPPLPLRAPHERTTALPITRAEPTPTVGRRRRWPWLMAGLLVLLAGAAGGWWFTAGPGGTTVIPPLVNVQVDAATSALDNASLIAETRETFSETVPAGVVVSASPPPGREVRKQSIVQLVVSNGQERYSVPKLVGSKADAAEQVLAAKHLSLGKTEQAWSETVAAGDIISQQPPPNTSVKRDTKVRIVVSKGRAPITVPDVRTKSLDEAKRLLTEAGLTVQRAAEDVNHDTIPAGHIVSQSPDKGTLFRGETVTLTVSKGPVLVQVPRVIGQKFTDAEPALKALGFTVKVERPLGTFFELVRRQSLEPNSMAPKGSVIVLVVV